MDFGMPVLIENKDLKENVQLCKELGLDFLELNMSFPQYQIEQLEQIDHLNALAKEAGIYYTIHLDENLNVADFNRAVAKAYLETVKRTIDVAHQVQIPVLNMHLQHGIYVTLPEKRVRLYEQYFEEYLSNFQSFIDMCEQEIGNDNIKICVENIDGFTSYEKAVIEKLLTSDKFALTWDIGHSNECGHKDDAFIMEKENHLHHFHVHDGMGKQVHIALGTGEIDLHQKLALARKHNCRCVVEVKTIAALRESVEWLNAKT